jgi:hypothetical protein
MNMSQPVHRIQDGTLEVAIWPNQGEKGTYYTATPQRSYRSGDDTWKETDSLSADDLLPMADLLREAYAWIRNQKRPSRSAGGAESCPAGRGGVAIASAARARYATWRRKPARLTQLLRSSV